ncbi:tRNA glutamyl-Q synthetase [Coraliomargarita akajimensis]|uniref:Glutamate--tRNA ligase n=1 Tax=Coraliomargarita akajimensis (strain DSM 45221 / IAM 15411 / JCM 23193 / KCTC 12865 / 04OKA010-24) TaxID=583355 RepID=D5EM82_CORAD|nr:tRNA glutamyl-Q synthetase [Coraliomargarita akajimensis]ADE55242.1 Glutamate--tRNA ligase [Coraliomargarita akajimensis DSM 45221]
MASKYRGRIAPTPTGYLHLGHARTFWIAMERAQEAGGQLLYREENLDPQRCKDDYAQAAIDDLKWFGCSWKEGPDQGGSFGPYRQSDRTELFLNAWERLKDQGFIYPCDKSRKDVAAAAQAPHSEDDAEPIYPEAWRPPLGVGQDADSPGSINWRFRVPEDRKIVFDDGRLGPCAFECQRDFGDFLVWRKDGVPAYELAVVVDDAAMQVTEVVRGEDLLISTARQLLIYEALGLQAPEFYHTPLMCDMGGQRLAKRHRSLSLRELREAGHNPATLRQSEDWWSGLED